MKNGWTESVLGELCRFEQGRSPTLKTEAGKYPLVVTASYRRSSAEYQFDEPAVCIPLISSTGHGNAALHRVHYQEGKFALANLLVAAIPKPGGPLDAKYLWRYLSAVKDKKLVQLMQGTANVSLKEKDLLSVTVPLPPLAEQRRIVESFDGIEARLTRANKLREEQEHELQAALRSAFHRFESHAQWIAMGELAPLVRREIEVDPEGSYPELGIRSFGRGTFHKPNVLGLETVKRLFAIHTGDLVFNNVFAWEGAVAIAQPEDHGRVGSHRFITCVCDPARALPKFVHFYFLTNDGLEKLGKASPGGAGRNRTLGIERLAQIQVPIVSLGQQVEFSKLLDLQAKIRTRAAESTERTAALIPSLLDGIFNS